MIDDYAVENLRKIAERRYKDPMNTWPLHNKRHQCIPFMDCTLFDEECLRCQLERAAAEAYSKKK